MLVAAWVVEAEEVRRREEHHVQQVALDPLARVIEPAQRAHRGVDRDAPGRLDRVHGAHLVRDRADAADASHQVGQLVGAPAARERLEEARRLVDLEAQVDDLVAFEHEMQCALALDAGERSDLDAPSLHHQSSRSRRSATSRNSRRQPLMCRRRRTASARERPAASKERISDAGFGSAAGPKQP